MDINQLNTKLANTLIGTENVIWDKHFNGRNLPKISDTVRVREYESTGESTDNITWKWHLSHRYIKSVYVSHYEDIERITLYDAGHKMDTIHKWMLPVIKTLYDKDQHNNRLPFDQVMGENYLISTTACIAIEFSHAIENCILTYLYYDLDVPIMMPPYFWYASSIELQNQRLVMSDIELQSSSTPHYYMKVDLNLNHPIYCLYFNSSNSVVSMRIDVNEQLLYHTNYIEKVGSCYIVPLHINIPLQSYQLDKVPLNASQAEIITLYVYFESSESPTTIDIAAMVYHNMITSRLSSQADTMENVGSLTGNDNIAVGSLSQNTPGIFTLLPNTIGNGKVAIGSTPLFQSTPDSNDIGIGRVMLMANTIGNGKVAIGSAALHQNTLGDTNAAIGDVALSQNTRDSNDSNDIGIGRVMLMANTIGNGKVAIGSAALHQNTLGDINASIGDVALSQNTTGSDKFGIFSLQSNTIGNGKVAIGDSALFTNMSNSNSIAIGNLPLSQGIPGGNVGIGPLSLMQNTTGSNKVAIGFHALSQSKNINDHVAVGIAALEPNKSGT
jgi:hypothetical protein